MPARAEILIPVVPGTTTAGDSITIPGGVKVAKIIKAVKITVSDGTAAGSVTDLTITTSTPSSGQIQLATPTTIVLGDNTSDLDILLLWCRLKEESSLG